MSGVAKAQEHKVLLVGSHPRPRLGRASSFRLYDAANDPALKRARSLFVLCDVQTLADVSSLVSAANKRHHLRLLLVFSQTDPSWLPQILDRADLRAVRNMVVHADADLGTRILRAWELGAEDALVARAVALDDALLVVTCAGERLEVNFNELPALRKIPRQERASVDVSPDGSYLHWPASDIHLDIDAIRAHLDPEWAQQALVRKLQHHRHYGAALRALRENARLAQTQIPGLSERQVRRLEQGESLSSASLRCYAEALRMELKDLLAAAAKQAQRRAA